MLSPKDSAYFSRRARQSALALTKATDRTARYAHRQLKAAYIQLNEGAVADAPTPPADASVAMAGGDVGSTADRW